MYSHFSNIVSLGYFTCLFTGLIIFTGCTKNYDDYGPQGELGNVEIPRSSSVIVLNEGNFMFGNGSVSWVDLENQNTSQEVFKTVNGFPLGDVPQSMIVSDSVGYVVVNNSSKIEVVTMPEFSSVSTITGFNSPRQMAIISEQPKIAWVTDLYANKIWEVNLDTRQIIGSISNAGWNENIMKWKSLALVLNKTDSVINVFDIATKSLIKTYQVSTGIVDFQFSSFSELKVLAKGGIYRINLLLDGVYEEYAFSVTRTPLKMAYDSINQTTYFLDGDLYRYSNNGLTMLKSVAPGSNFYGLAVNNEKVYLTDTKDYVQPGELNVYSYDFQTETVFPMGVNPQFIFFP
ncbi:MAG: YncE family protein [Salibacteraceae bacterium]